MKRKNIDAMHEVRLFLVQVVMPIGLLVYGFAMQYPRTFRRVVRDFRTRMEQLKWRIRKFVFCKKKES